MATTTNLGKIHDFPSMESYNSNKTSVGTSDLALVPTSGGTIIETYINGTDWYRLWSDGFLEQGGMNSSSSSVPITFLMPFANDNYVLVVGNTNGTDRANMAVKISGNGDKFTVSGSAYKTARNWNGWVAFGSLKS